MKKVILFLGGILVLLFLIVGCTISAPAEVPITTSWTLSGTESWTNGSLSGDPTNDVKLAAFYTGDSLTMKTSSVIVSNVVNCGNDTTADLAFSLTIDASAVSPTKGDYIVIKRWEDVDGNDKWDDGESSYTANPTIDCPCFNPSGSSSSLLSCSYYYDDSSNSIMKTEKGWNQSVDSLEYSPIDSATKTGAKIDSDTFYTNS